MVRKEDKIALLLDDEPPEPKPPRNMGEDCNLQESLKEKAGSSGGYPRHILYGCTDLVSGDEFIRQIESILPPLSSTTAGTVAK